MTTRTSGADREELAKRAFDLYITPMTVREVGERLGCSYGKAHALITQAAGNDVFRARGTRSGGVRRANPTIDGAAPDQQPMGEVAGL